MLKKCLQPTSPTPTHTPAYSHSQPPWLNQKTPQKRGQANTNNGQDAEDSNKEKGKTKKDKNRSKQLGHANAKGHPGENPMPRHTPDPMRTPTKTQSTNPTHDKDERGNNAGNPAPTGLTPSYHPDNYPANTLTPEEEQEIYNYQMLHQDVDDIDLYPDADTYLDHTQPFRSDTANLKDMMDYLLKKLIQLKAEENLTAVDFDSWAKKITTLNAGLATGTQTDPTIAYVAETNVYLTRRIKELESGSTLPEHILNCDPAMTAIPMNQPNQALWAAIAARPATNQRAKKPNQTRPTNTTTDQSQPTMTADPCCLIIQVNPPLPATERPDGIATRTKINSILKKK